MSSWLAEQEVRGSIPGLAATIPEIGNLLRRHHYYLNEKTKRYTSSSRFGPTITVAESWPNNDLRESGKKIRSSDGVVVKLLACRARGLGSIPGLAATIPEWLSPASKS